MTKPSELRSPHLITTAHAERDGDKLHRWVLFDGINNDEVPHLTSADDARRLAAWLLMAADWLESD